MSIDFINPKRDEILRISDKYGITLSQEEVEVFEKIFKDNCSVFKRVENLSKKYSDKTPKTKRNGHSPSVKENPYNAWCWKCSIKEASNGKLKNKQIAVKDTVFLRGTPLMNGSNFFKGFKPHRDAEIVTRILSEGGEIVGKTTCEALCFSGSSHTSFPKPVLNPNNPKYIAGGSSSGSAVVVATKEVDMAIGGDQGGSIRIPSALCGIYGLKPTFGLLPYSGVIPMENSLDHIGPMSSTIYDMALLLDVIAGYDQKDPRQKVIHEKEIYTESLNKSLKGLKIGIVQEGFDWDIDNKEPSKHVKKSALSFSKFGFNVDEISIPIHKHGIDIWSAIAGIGIFNQMVRGHCFGFGWLGEYPEHAIDFISRSLREKPENIPETVKPAIIFGDYAYSKHYDIIYAKSKNLITALIKAYDYALEKYDLLVMPTVAPCGIAIPLKKKYTLQEYFDTAFCYHNNTCAFNLTGHPALNIPCGKINGLPVGMMVIGKKFDEATILAFASFISK